MDLFNVPQGISYFFIIGGALMSTFAQTVLQSQYQYLLFGIGVALCVVGLILLTLHVLSHRKPFLPRNTKQEVGSDITVTQYVDLPEAARRAYEELRNTEAGRISSGLNKENPLGYWVHAIWQHLEVEGIAKHCIKFEPINRRLNKPSSSGKSAGRSYEDSDFTSLRVKLSDLDVFISEVASSKVL